MLVEETERTSLESHCLIEKPLNAKEHVEHLLNVIKSMYEKKLGTPTQNMERFMRRKLKEYEHIPDYANDFKDTLYKACPGQPKYQLEELLIAYFIHWIFITETKSKLKAEGPLTLVKALEKAQFYEDVLNNNTIIVNQTEFLTPPGYSLIETPASSSNPQHNAVRMMQNTIDNFLAPTRTPNQRAKTKAVGTIDVPS